MNGQDWETITVSKTAKQKVAGLSSAQAIAKGKMSGTVVTEAKHGAGTQAGTGGGASLKKLEESTDTFAHKTVDASLSKAITQARMAKKMTQAQLATAINEQGKVIQEYESGKAIPNPNVINKLDKVLGIHLPRNKKK